MALTACSLGVPKPMGVGCRWSDEDIHLAAALFESEWSEWFGVGVAGMTDNISVECTSEPILEKYSGVHLGQGRIVIMDQDYGVMWRLHETALMHELTHFFLEEIEGDGDASHAAGEGPWTERHDRMIGEAGKRLSRVLWR